LRSLAEHPFQLIAKRFELQATESWRDAGFLTFITADAAAERASSPGVVVGRRVRGAWRPHPLLPFSVTVRPNDDSAFFLEYRNLKGLAVAERATPSRPGSAR
jgi:hypothetical protein